MFFHSFEVLLIRGLFVGRFQPFHNGHLEAINYILKKTDELIIVVGSSQLSHEKSNPFTAGERVTMIRLALNDIGIDTGRYFIIPVPDVTVHSTWFSELRSYVPDFEIVYSNEPLTRLLVKEAGFKVSSIPLFTRKLFKATEIRSRILSGENWSNLVPRSVANFIEKSGCAQRIIDMSSSDFADDQC